MKTLPKTSYRSAVHIDDDGVATVEGDTLTVSSFNADHPQGFELTYEDGSIEVIAATRLAVRRLIIRGSFSM